MTETIGQQLKQARLAKNLDIEKVVQATRIRSYAIQALEADNFESLPSPVQARGFLKIYADFLGLSLEGMYARQKGESSPGIESSPPAETNPPPDEKSTLPEPAASPSSLPKKPRTRKKTSSPPPGEEKTPEPEPAPVVAPRDVAVTSKPVQHSVNAVQHEADDLSSEERQAKVISTLPVSQTIFNAIGEKLRQRRESLSLSLEEIERHTHVRKHFLKLLENGQFGELPSSVQARGMLNNYARFLDLDEDALLLEFAEGLQTQLAERQPQPDSAPPGGQKPARKIAIPPAFQRILSPDILVGGGLVILLVIFAIWGTGRIIKLSAVTTPEPTAPSISNILLSSPLAEEATSTLVTTLEVSTVSPGPGATLDVTLPPAGSGAVQVIVVATRRAWVKVTVDNKVEFEGRMVPGATYAYDADTQIEVVTGDGSAVSIIYNQSNLGAMGAYGEIVDRIYTSTTILLPTATFTPTWTITQTPTITPRPSATPRPSITPRPSATTNP